jgi:hypothetical protein
MSGAANISLKTVLPLLSVFTSFLTKIYLLASPLLGTVKEDNNSNPLAKSVPGCTADLPDLRFIL